MNEPPPKPDPNRCRVTRVNNPGAPWMVSFPAERAGKVRRIRKSFASQERARQFAVEMDAKNAKYGIRLGSLPPEVRRAYQYFREESSVLAAKGLTVPDFESLVRNATRLLHHEADDLKFTVSEAIERFLADKKSRVRPGTHRSLQLRLRLFAQCVGNRPIRSIDSHDAKGFLSGLQRQRKLQERHGGLPSPSRLSALSINYYRSALSALFHHAEQQNWIARNPITAVRREVVERIQVSASPAYGLSDVALIMHTALHYRAEVVPVLALSMFAGLRVSEAARTDLSSLFAQAALESGHFAISRGRSKTNNHSIPMAAALPEWLNAQPRKVGNAWEGTQQELRAKIREVLTMSGAEPTIDSPRYTYIRYRLELTRDVLGIMLECGITLALVQTLSLNPVSSENANMFFSITPSTII